MRHCCVTEKMVEYPIRVIQNVVKLFTKFVKKNWVTIKKTNVFDGRNFVFFFEFYRCNIFRSL